MVSKPPISSQELRHRAEELFLASENFIPESTSPEKIKQLLYELRVHQIQLEMQNEELRSSQEALDSVQTRYFDLYDLAPVGYLTICKNHLIREVNFAASTMFGVARNSLVDKGIRKILHEEDQATFFHHLEQCNIFSQEQEWEMLLKRHDGERFWAHLQATPAENGECWITVNDISERKKLEEEKLLLEQQLEQSQRLESLGVLAGGIAHDFNNILAIILGYCGLTKLNYDNAEKNIPKIEIAVERAAALCRQMLTYAGKTQLFQTMIVMWVLVDDVVSMLKATTSLNVVFKTHLSSDIPIITGDATQLRQVIMNLIINASEAIGEKQGEVCISLSKLEIKVGESIYDHQGKIIPVGSYLCMEVVDNGCGMDEETKRRIFEPFYSTKFSGRGLGMSAVLGIITSHKGALQFSSQPGHGTAFKVYLPVVISEENNDEESAVTASAPWQGTGTILLVEDEEQLMLIARTMLKVMGFRVIEAINGKEALDMYKKNVEEITLVITDMGMPVMSGYELFRELKTLNPKLPIVISSGYGDTVVTSRISRDKIAGLVCKPYNFEQLREVVKGVVG